MFLFLLAFGNILDNVCIGTNAPGRNVTGTQRNCYTNSSISTLVVELVKGKIQRKNKTFIFRKNHRLILIEVRAWATCAITYRKALLPSIGCLYRAFQKTRTCTKVRIDWRTLRYGSTGAWRTLRSGSSGGH